MLESFNQTNVHESHRQKVLYRMVDCDRVVLTDEMDAQTILRMWGISVR
jgi:hypothetical protein